MKKQILVTVFAFAVSCFCQARSRSLEIRLEKPVAVERMILQEDIFRASSRH